MRFLAAVTLAHALVISRRVGDDAQPQDFPVDVVIASSLESNRSLLHDPSGAMVERNRSNGELVYTLRSIARNAPWVNKIYLLQNGPNTLPEWVAEPEKTVMVDRCTLLKADECPTRNSFVVYSVAHKVPGLSEHFIYTDDDNMVTQKTTVNDFFDGEKPRFPAGKGDSIMYHNPSATGLTKIPRSGGMVHTWNALTKSLCNSLEEAYPAFFAFLRSHKDGRYSSELNAFGTPESEGANSLEEDLIGVWWWWLHESGGGSPTDSATFSDHRIGNPGSEAKWKQAMAHPPVIQNINDDLPAHDDAAYKRGHAVALSYLEKWFPDPKKRSREPLLREEQDVQ